MPWPSSLRFSAGTNKLGCLGAKEMTWKSVLEIAACVIPSSFEKTSLQQYSLTQAIASNYK